MEVIREVSGTAVTWLKPRLSLFAAAMLFLAVCRSASAIIVLRSPGRNTFVPTGALNLSGYQFEGDWHHFPGTAVGPHHFLAAAHTGGLPLQAFRYRGVDYYSLDRTIVPGTDLALWRIAGTFPEWATLYDAKDETGKDVVLYGRGGPRGAPLMTRKVQRGWWWTDSDGRLSWGRSRVAGATAIGDSRTPYGPVLSFPFNPKLCGDAGEDTASVSGGDSGGGVFLRDTDGKWKLCGVIYGVDNNFSITPKGKQGIDAALYDARGLYRITPDGTYYLDPDLPYELSSTCIASRVSPYVPYLNFLMSQPPRWKLYAASFGVLVGTVLAVAVVFALFRRRLIHIWWLRKQRKTAKTGSPDTDAAAVAEAAGVSDAGTLP